MEDVGTGSDSENVGTEVAGSSGDYKIQRRLQDTTSEVGHCRKVKLGNREE